LDSDFDAKQTSKTRKVVKNMSVMIGEFQSSSHGVQKLPMENSYMIIMMEITRTMRTGAAESPLVCHGSDEVHLY